MLYLLVYDTHLTACYFAVTINLCNFSGLGWLVCYIPK